LNLSSKAAPIKYVLLRQQQQQGKTKGLPPVSSQAASPLK